MKKLLLLLVLSLLALEARSAAPVISCTPSRTTGTAPLFVHLDCTGTTDSDTTKPFHDLFYVHTFGDPSAGLWAYGANTALSKNFATGPVAGHVYETAGTYTITSTVSDGTNIARTTNTITVTAADTTYSGTATVCFSTSGTFTGCPSGATQTTSSDFDSAIGSCHSGATKRCLFRRTETFVASACSGLAVAGPTTIGAYGSGAKPIITAPTADCVFNFPVTTTNDTRVMDLNIQGTNSAHSSEYAFGNGAAISGVTILRVDMTNMGTSAINWDNTCTNCVIQDSTATGNRLSALVYTDLASSAVLGNSFGPIGSGGEQILRLAKWQKTYIASNLITSPAASKEGFACRARTHTTNADDSFYNIFADNKVTQGTASTSMVQCSAGGGGDVRYYDIIMERNWLLTDNGPEFTVAFQSGGVRMTFRNNLVDMSGPAATLDRAGFGISKEATDPNPTDVQILNNTIYNSKAAASQDGIRLFASATNSVVKNTLCYFAVSGNSCLSDGGTGTTKTNNTGDTGTITTDPSFDTPLTSPIGFRIGTGSYAAPAGTAIWPASNDDFFHCDDTTANEHMGAFISRTRATCRGAAGP